MTYNEAEKICNYRIQYCANLYGAKWREENDFLNACGSALAEVQKQKTALFPEDIELIIRMSKTYCETDMTPEQKEQVDNLVEVLEVMLSESNADGDALDSGCDTDDVHVETDVDTEA